MIPEHTSICFIFGGLSWVSEKHVLGATLENFFYLRDFSEEETYTE